MRKLPLTIFLLLSAFGPQGFADTITLKSGEKIEGAIVSETDTQVTVSVQVSASIADEKILSKADIAKIEKPTEDGILFDQLKTLKTDPMIMLTRESYKNAIDALQSFQDKYPQSTHKADVQAILDTFLDEKKHQDAGETKLYGLWISAKESTARSQQIQGQAHLFRTKSFIAQGDLVGALNEFDTLEKTYATTRAYPLVIEQIKPVTQTLLVQVTRAIDTLKIKNDEWAKGVAITPEPRKSEIIAARRAELDRYDAMVDAAQKNQQKWPPFIAESQKSLDAILALVTPERARILALPTDKMNLSVAATDKASEAISANDLDGADALLKDALALWPQNEDATYYQKYITDFKAAKLAGKNNPNPGGPKPKVDKIATRATPAPAPGAATPTPTPVEKATATPGEKSAADDQGSGSFVDFFFTITGAVTVVGVLVAFLVLLTFLQKLKKPKADEEEA